MEKKKTFWTKFLDWIIQKTLKDLINYIKAVVGEATIAADINTWGSWSNFLLNLVKDLLEGYKEINAAPATKSGKPMSVNQVQKVYRTSTAAGLIKAKEEGKL
jgi:hypothetical protein